MGQEGDRSDQNWTGVNTERFGFEKLFNWLFRKKLEGLIGLKLRNNIVIVRVEPLRHFAGRDAAAASGMVLGARLCYVSSLLCNFSGKWSNTKSAARESF